jgi:hypothetical protein
MARPLDIHPSGLPTASRLPLRIPADPASNTADQTGAGWRPTSHAGMGVT